MLKHLFFKTMLFKARATQLEAWADVDELKVLLDVNPEIGDVIPGGDGLRKVRIPLRVKGTGKRGGGRVIYYQVSKEGFILLVFIFAKSEKENLDPAELADLVEIKKIAVGQFRKQIDEQELRKGNPRRARSDARRPIKD